MQHRFLRVSCVLGLCGLVSVAAAEPTAAQKEQARQLMASGRAQRNASDLQAALRSFSAADAIMHVPTTLYEVAATQAALGQLLAARETLKALARLDATPDEPEAFTHARHAGYELSTNVEQRIPAIDVSIQGDLSDTGSSLSVDG